jgi:NADH:ubiquinone oxidoreductase subunit 6 (subunit J)
MMIDYLTFRKMITPTLLQVIFWIGEVMIVIMALVMMFSGGQQTVHGPFGPIVGSGFVLGLFVLLAGSLVWRVYCELLIVIFRILDVLVEIRNKHTGVSAERMGV